MTLNGTLNKQKTMLKQHRYNELKVPAEAARRSENLLRKNVLKAMETNNLQFDNLSLRWGAKQQPFIPRQCNKSISGTEKIMLKQMGAKGLLR